MSDLELPAVDELLRALERAEGAPARAAKRAAPKIEARYRAALGGGSSPTGGAWASRVDGAIAFSDTRNGPLVSLVHANAKGDGVVVVVPNWLKAHQAGWAGVTKASDKRPSYYRVLPARHVLPKRDNPPLPPEDRVILEAALAAELEAS